MDSELSQIRKYDGVLIMEDVCYLTYPVKNVLKPVH